MDVVNLKHNIRHELMCLVRVGKFSKCVCV